MAHRGPGPSGKGGPVAAERYGMVHGRARESAFPRPLRVAAAFAVAAAAAFVPAGAGAAPSPPSPAEVPPTAAAVQDEPLSCKDCHEEVQEASLASIHGKVVA